MTVTPIPAEMSLFIGNYVTDVLKNKRNEVKVLTLISKKSFSELLERTLSSSLDRFDWSFEKVLDRENFVLSKGHLRRDLYVRSIRSDFYVLENGPYTYVITRGNKRFIKSGIYYLVRKLYPEVIIAYLTSMDIFDLLNNFRKNKDVDIFYKRAVSKNMAGEPDTDVTYKRKVVKVDFREAFKKASSQGQWVDKILLFTDEFRYHFNLSRDGILKFKQGNLNDYWSLLVQICDRYMDRVNLFSNRSRLEQLYHRTKPLIFPFKESIFNDASIRNQFLDTLGDYPFCFYSVVHAGNPHIHVNMVDKLDNSMFSLRTYSSNSIIIGPQIKTTEASIMRILKYLVENFREANIADLSGD